MHNHDGDNAGQQNTQTLNYEKPKLTQFGSIDKLTQGVSPNPK